MGQGMFDDLAISMAITGCAFMGLGFGLGLAAVGLFVLLARG